MCDIRRPQKIRSRRGNFGNQADDLPSEVRSTLEDFIAAAVNVSGSNLRSAILFGSAAEGQLRPTSDVNLVLVFGTVLLLELARLRTHLSFARVATFSLLDRGLVLFDGRTLCAKSRITASPVRRPLEKALLERLVAPTPTSRLLADAALRSACAGYADALRDLLADHH